MRIVTTSVDDFLANCDNVKVWEGRIYYERSSHPLNGKTKADATSFKVVFQLSCVLNVGDGQALLACGVDCGTDRLTGDGDTEGTEEQKRLFEKVECWCREHNVRLLPGILDQ